MTGLLAAALVSTPGAAALGKRVAFAGAHPRAQLALAQAPAGLRTAVERALTRDALRASYGVGAVRVAGSGWSGTVGLGRIGRPGGLLPIGGLGHRGATSARYGTAGLDESFAMARGGIEQSFSIAARPPGSGPLLIEIPLSGLRASGSGGVLVLHAAGRTVGSYRDLRVVDATGRVLDATMNAGTSGRTIAIEVSDTGARYPLRVDPLLVQSTKLAVPDQNPTIAKFGSSVALSSDGNIALVGGPEVGVGDAWVFTRSGGVWTQQGPTLSPSDGTANALFGESVALSSDGNTALIGGMGDSSFTGAAWVFVRTGDVWTQQGPKLTAAGESGAGRFGDSVALSADGNTAVIGSDTNDGNLGGAWVFTRSNGAWAPQGSMLSPSDGVGSVVQFGITVALSADGNTVLIGGNGDRGGFGAAWIFTRAGTAWSQDGSKLSGGGEDGAASFGESLALSPDGSTALIGGPHDDNDLGAAWLFTQSQGVWTQAQELTATGESGDGLFGSSTALSQDGSIALIGGMNDANVGAAWQFTLSNGAWSEDGAKLTGADETGAGEFGASVALSSDGTTALIGGPNDEQAAIGDIGAAWAFTASNGVLTQQGPKLTGGSEDGLGAFGTAVALSSDGDTAIVGAPDDLSGFDVGAAWIFTQANGVWMEQGPKLTPSQPWDDGYFGQSVALSSDGNTALIGSPGQNGNVGAAWVFTRSSGVWTQQGPPLTGAGESGAGQFGQSVALSADGNTALVGGFTNDGNLGGAWVFTRSNGAWAPQGSLLSPSDGQGPVVQFGISVALSGDGNTALIGGNGDGGGFGAAWIFTRTGTTWTQDSKLSGSGLTGFTGFGEWVALSGDASTALIGSSAGPDAWVFTQSGGVWTQQSTITPSDPTGTPTFGRAVALTPDGNTALIGGPNDNSEAGAAWVFTRSNGAWTQDGAKLTGADETGVGEFGSSVALSSDGTTALIGGPNDGSGVGAAWVFAGTATSVTSGSGTPPATGNGGGSQAPSTPSTPAAPAATAAPPPSGVAAAVFGAPTSETVTAATGLTLTGSQSGASATVSVPAGALPSGTTVSIYPVTDTGALSAEVPAGQSYVVSFAVSWQAPDGTSPAATTPITMTIDDPGIVDGDVVYEVESRGLVVVGTATADGVATITFESDPTFVVSAPLHASVVVGTTRYVVTRNALPLELECSAKCSGVAELTGRIGKKTTVVLARRAYAMQQRATRTVMVPLTKAGQRAFRAARTHALRVTLDVTVLGGHSISKVVSVHA